MTGLSEKKILIIAGPNGAGKTTFAEEFLPNEAHCPTFINADLIAAGLSPFEPDAAALKAGRLMLSEIDRYVASGNSFAFETTLSGRTYAQRISHWQTRGYRINLLFLRLTTVELAIERVRQRVASGGHSVAEPVVRRRFVSGWRNFNQLYKPLVDGWALYDSSESIPVLVDRGVK